MQATGRYAPSVLERHRRALAAVLPFAAVAILASSCAIVPSCPTSVDHATSGEFQTIGDTTYVAVGRVARYVGSANLESRGYDLDIRRTLSGTTSSEGTFLRIADALPGVTQGQAVLIIGEPGPNERVILPGACAALQPISDAELIRWTGNR